LLIDGSYVDAGIDTDKVIADIRTLPGMDVVLNRKDGCARFDLPEDRVGEIIVVSKGTKVIGTSEANHDLSGLEEPLRSHGGITEQTIPILGNVRFKDLPTRLRNYDAFAIGLNHVG
jgi:phosphonoacetate hydrolase